MALAKPKPKYTDPLVAWMEANGIPVTRDNYIELAYGYEPLDWDIENELDLPEEIQDFDLFEMVDGQMEYLGMKQKQKAE